MKQFLLPALAATAFWGIILILGVLGIPPFSWIITAVAWLFVLMVIGFLGMGIGKALE